MITQKSLRAAPGVLFATLHFHGERNANNAVCAVWIDRFDAAEKDGAS